MSKVSSQQRVDAFRLWLEWFHKNRPKPKVKVEDYKPYSKTN